MNRLRKAYGDKFWFQYRRAYHRGRYSELPVFGDGSSAVEAVGGGEIFRDKWWIGDNGDIGQMSPERRCNSDHFDLIKDLLDWLVPKHGTMSFGISGIAGGVVYIAGSISLLAIDSHGNLALLSPSVGGGALLPVAAEIAVFGTATEADNIDQLEGLSMILGGSAELEGSVGYEGISFKDPNTGEKLKGGTVTIGLGQGAPLPGEGHVGVNYTWNLLTINLYELFGITE